MKKDYQALRYRLFVPFLLMFYLFTASQIWAAKSVSQLEGVLEIRLASYLDQDKSRTTQDVIEYALRTDNGVYSLKFTDQAPTTLQTGQRVKIKGGQQLAPNADGVIEIMLSGKDLVIIQDLTKRELPQSFGDQKTVVMLVNFQDDAGNKPWTKQQVNDVIFNTIDSMFYEFSYNQTTVTGDVFGWYTIALDKDATCGSIRNSLPYMANEAAQKAGVDLSKYTRRVYMFPRNTNCQWAGLGTVGGYPSLAWINGINNAGVTAHELGHNLGLYHSHSLECDGGPNKGTCGSVEYGDYADTMGFPYFYDGPHFNAFQKERLGWLNFKNSPPIQTVTESGTYTIDPYETANAKVKALKILKEKQAGDSENYYYLEFRQGIGFDEKMGDCDNCDFTKGVLVHEGNLLNANSSFVLDMSNGDGKKSHVVTLHPGQSFEDKGALNDGVTITVDSISENGAKVNVQFGKAPPPVCKRFNPTLTVVPYDTVFVKPGETGFYNYTLWNNDDPACGASNYALTAVADSHIGISMQSQFMHVKPGERRDFFVSATARIDTPVGPYGVAVKAENLSDPVYFTSNIARMAVR